MSNVHDLHTPAPIILKIDPVKMLTNMVERDHAVEEASYTRAHKAGLTDADICRAAMQIVAPLAVRLLEDVDDMSSDPEDTAVDLKDAALALITFTVLDGLVRTGGEDAVIVEDNPEWQGAAE